MLTLTESLIHNLTLLLCLTSIGEPLRFALVRFSGLFRRLNVLEGIVLDTYLGGLILYVIATIPLHLFDSGILTWLLLTSIGLSLVLHSKDFLRLSHVSIQITKSFFSTHASAIFEGIIVFSFFLTTLYMESIPVTNYIFGSVHDSSLYGLFVKLILQNRQVPRTMLPYSTEGIYYPQAFFIIEAFGHLVTGLHLAEVTLRITPLFQSLTVLGAYYLGRQFSPEKHLGMSFAFVFFAISRWPRLLVWGSNPFVAGFPLYFICTSLLLQLRSNENLKERLVRLAFIGILIGYLGAINLVFLQSLAATVVIVAFANLVRRNNPKVRSRVLDCMIVLGCSVFVISPYIYRFAVSVPYLGHNIGLPPDVLVPSADEAFSRAMSELKEIYHCFFVSDWISPHRILKFETTLLISTAISIIFTTVYVWKKERFELKNSVGIISLSLAGATFVLVTRILGMFISLSLVTIVTHWAETAILMFVSICFFVCVFNVLFCYDVHELLSRRCRLLSSRKKIYSGAFAILILLSAYTPYLYYLFVRDSDYLIGQYNLFCVTTKSDFELMRWMKHNVTKEATILINPFDSGAFIPIVSGIKIIHPFTYSRYSLSYLTLTNSLRQKKLNEEVYDMLEKLNISHIFIGEKAMPRYERFDPLLFLENPNFMLERQVGNAYLFAFVNLDRNMTNLDV